ncbi:MAG TPA: PQQ-dependent sugar dehydrogenase [Solirubrobacterales bacterium]
MIRRVAVGLVLLVGLVAAPGAGAATLPSGFQDETAFEFTQPGAEQPTTFKFAPDGRTFVALKGGKIVVFPAGSGPGATPEIFANLAKETYDNGDHGLLGLALDPEFDSGRPYVYALYTYNHVLGAPAGEMPRWPSVGSGPTEFEGDECTAGENKCLVSGRLVRLTAEGNHAQPSAGAPEETVLLEGWCQQSTTHSIGDLAFGPEGALFASGGEGAAFTVADYGQFENLCGDPVGTIGAPLTPPSAEGGSLRSQSFLRPGGEVLLSGTVVRVDPDSGEGWPGNPFAADANANKRRIVAAGLRNPFRFALSARLGQLFVNNVGAGQDEEIDRFAIGSGQVYNSGWPCYEGLEPNGQFKSVGLVACERLYNAPGSTSPPFFHYSHFAPVAPGDPCPAFNGSAISGSAFYEGTSYPATYDDALFFADSVRGCIYAMLAEEDGEPDPLAVVPVLTEGSSYPGVDLEQGPEGSIYYATLYGNAINRIAYDPGAPTARLKADRLWGETPLTVQFEAGESSGPPGDSLEYEWDLDGDGTFGPATPDPTESETYGAATNVTAAVRVKDLDSGKSSVDRLNLYPGDSPPQVEISAPAPGLTWGVGQTINFAGSAKAMGGTGPSIPPAGLYWKTRLLHCPFTPEDCHEHPIQVFPGIASSHIEAPDHDYPSYINFILTATDERGLSAEASVKIAARPVSVQLRSNPPGIELVAGTKTLRTPSDLLVIENSPTTMIAPATAEVGGYSYTFQGWSDGGARVHTVTGSSPAAYTATYSGGPPAGGDNGGGGSSNGGGKPPPTYKPPKIQKRPQKKTTSRTAKFVFKGEAGLRYRCKIDNRKFASCRSPRTYRRLAIGKHAFRVYAVDAAGSRLSATTTFSWKIVEP